LLNHKITHKPPRQIPVCQSKHNVPFGGSYANKKDAFVYQDKGVFLYFRQKV